MSIVEFNGGPVTHRYLMNKTKSELASMYMDLLRRGESLERLRDLLYDGYAVHQHLRDDAKGRTRTVHVSDVLDALKDAWKTPNAPKLTGAPHNERSEVNDD